MIHLDASFVIDFLRETGKRRRGAATEFLVSLVGKGEEITVSVFVACELSLAIVEGARLVTRNLKDFERIPDLEILSY